MYQIWESGIAGKMSASGFRVLGPVLDPASYSPCVLRGGRHCLKQLGPGDLRAALNCTPGFDLAQFQPLYVPEESNSRWEVHLSPAFQIHNYNLFKITLS